jgi:hypothetical protein
MDMMIAVAYKPHGAGCGSTEATRRKLISRLQAIHIFLIALLYHSRGAHIIMIG